MVDNGGENRFTVPFERVMLADLYCLWNTAQTTTSSRANLKLALELDQQLRDRSTQGQEL